MEIPKAEAEAELRGQAQVWHQAFSFIDSVALKCAVELRIADIIHSQGSGGPISLSRIASCIDNDDEDDDKTGSGSPSGHPDVSFLARIMRLLVGKNIFTAHQSPDGEPGEKLYGLNHCSKWLLRDSESTLAPLILLQGHPYLMNSWRCLGACVKRGGSAFKNFHGSEFWDLTDRDPEFNNLFNEAMACIARITLRAVLSGYKDGFSSVKGTLVDVGGRTGEVLGEIVKAFPHIKATNFDLPHVIASAPVRPGVTHVGGDMFEAIPDADAVLIQWTMHNWSDEDCVKILKNCGRAISGRPEGKVIIVDIVVREEEEDIFEYGTSLLMDLLMMALTNGGTERSEMEWKDVLEKGGFPRYKITKIPALLSIIEAFPES